MTISVYNHKLNLQICFICIDAVLRLTVEINHRRIPLLTFISVEFYFTGLCVMLTNVITSHHPYVYVLQMIAGWNS